MTARMEDVSEMLGHKRLALVGVSHDGKDFSRALMRELLEHGYDVVPVNPNAESVEDQVCHGHVGEIDPPVQWALLMTPVEVAQQVVEECHAAGIDRIWMHRGAGPGAVSPEAAQWAREHRISVVEGQCPLMFLEDAGLIHRLHGLVKKIARTYPE